MTVKNSSTKPSETPLLRDADLEAFIVDFVNADLPGEDGAPPNFEKAVTKLKDTTYEHWPDLWKWIGDDPTRAIETIRKVRWYLRQIWEARDEQRREWYIYRVRAYHHLYSNHPNTPGALERDDPVLHSLIWQYRQFLNEKEEAIESIPLEIKPRYEATWAFGETPKREATADEVLAELKYKITASVSRVNIAAEMILDQPPSLTPFDKCILRLRSLGNRLLWCHNPQCELRYSIKKAGDRNTVYCSRDCRLADGQPKYRRDNYYNKEKGKRQKRARRMKR